MRISVQRVGGLLGARRPFAELDTERLCEDDRRQILEHLERTKFWELPEELTGVSSTRDGQGTIVQVQDGERSHAVGFELAAAPEAIKAFVSFVRVLASKGASG